MRVVINKLLSLLRINSYFFVAIVFAGVFFVGSSWSTVPENEKNISEQLNSFVIANSNKIILQLDSLASDLNANSVNSSRCIKHYEAMRRLYKEIEFYTEYHFAFHSKYFINSPLVNKAEAEFGFKTFVPHGFQVIESVIYSSIRDTSINTGYEISLLKKSFEYIAANIKGRVCRNASVVDMARFEIIRIMSLYLNGYDATINKQNLKETKSILQGIRIVLKLLPATEQAKQKSASLIKGATFYLEKNKTYDGFDRLYFITQFLKPLYESLYEFYRQPETKEQTNYAVHIRSRKFYEKDWYNSNYFSVVLRDSLFVSQQAELGKLLFFDPVLSGDNKRACASCHNPDNALGGNIDFDRSFSSDEKLTRNTPSLMNVALQRSFFEDGRSLQLEDQASEVLTNHKEMNTNPVDLVHKLQQSPEYLLLFKKAFAHTEDTAITYYGVLKALAEYERKLIALNSRFDKYLRGDATQLSKEERAGYTIFAGKAMCGTCHFFPLFNGLAPPFYSDNEFEVIGVPKDCWNTELDKDSGRLKVSNNSIHQGAFKTPGLRNLGKTAPYMHNAAYSTIDEVLEFYQKGGGVGLGFDVPNQTLPFDSLKLTTIEVNQLKQFLKSLEDTDGADKGPAVLPKIDLPGLEKRKVGGEY